MVDQHEVERDSDGPLVQETAFQRHLLLSISRLDQRDEPVHGLKIRSWLQQFYPNEINPGRLYPNLDTLARRGLVQKSELDPRTNRYELTRRGRMELESEQRWTQRCLDGDQGEQR